VRVGSIKIRGRIISADYETGAPKAGFKEKSKNKNNKPPHHHNSEKK